MELQEVVIVSACRTALGEFLGSLKSVQARDLAITAGGEAIKRSGIPADQIDEICMGQIFSALQGSLPARQVAMRLGLPGRSGAVSVNQNCASGMRALEIAAHNIMLGKTEIALIVAVESMTNAPYIMSKGRLGYKMGPGTLEDHMYHDALIDELVPGHVGLTAENIGLRYNITREECDELAVLSQTRARAAIDEGRFKREIVPVEIKSKKGSIIFDTDEHVDRDATLEGLAELSPAFREDGVVTIGNASGICDGAAATVIMSRKKAAELGIRPLMKLVNVCTEGVAPEIMGLGPAVVIPKCLNQAGMKFGDIEYWEINEAFAVQILGVKRMLKEGFNITLDIERHNHNGSGISLGHPVGCTGLRLIVTLYYEMERLGLTTGGVSLCVGGGPAMASLWTRDV
ncbi:MAG: thiolase family protein [Deltaproteobacteria bacterium]|nr:thiolase family protein [Deltaproteobacteria bacterium]